MQENSTIIEHADGTVHLEPLASGRTHLRVELHDSSEFSPRLEWDTAYSESLIRAFLEVRGPAYLCDEICRDEDPSYLQKDLETQLYAYVRKEQLRGGRVLDFGCGCGASTAILARLFPETEFIGVELEPVHVRMARQRAEFYGLGNMSFLQSPHPDSLPDEADDVDFVFLSAVFEHLLPDERPKLLTQLWERLRPGGVLLINQTPDLRFPIETHTTGLPFLNYLPDGLALWCARRFSKRVELGESWRALLRAGVRGSTPRRILRLLENSSAKPTMLRPFREAGRRQSDLWYVSARERLGRRYRGARRTIALALMQAIPALGIPVAPYITIAIQKQAERQSE